MLRNRRPVWDHRSGLRDVSRQLMPSGPARAVLTCHFFRASAVMVACKCMQLQHAHLGASASHDPPSDVAHPDLTTRTKALPPLLKLPNPGNGSTIHNTVRSTHVHPQKCWLPWPIFPEVSMGSTWQIWQPDQALRARRAVKDIKGQKHHTAMPLTDCTSTTANLLVSTHPA